MRFTRSQRTRELEAQVDDLERLIAYARTNLQAMKALINEMAPLVAEFPRVAEASIGLMRENRQLRGRAETAERDFLLVGEALIRDEFSEHYEDD
jgi:indole-3-glycerol phosphate synthase